MDKFICLISISVIFWINAQYSEAVTCEAGWYLDGFVCKRCIRGSYISEVSHSRDTCTICPVSNETGMPGYTKSSESESLEDCFFEPHIIDFNPKIGPLSGGTKIVVDLIAFDDESYNVTHVYIASSALDVIDINLADKQLTLLTPGVNDLVNGTVQLTFSYDKLYETNESFYYVKDPIIENIDKMDSFISGGLAVGITGQYLDHINEPRMIISLVFGGRITTVYSPCNVVNSTYMECRTPDLTSALQANGIATDRRKRRDVVLARTLNDDDKQFYAGFELDSVVEYRNISATIPEYGQFQIYLNPEYFEFEDDDLVKNYDVSHGFLHIPVSSYHIKFES